MLLGDGLLASGWGDGAARGPGPHQAPGGPAQPGHPAAGREWVWRRLPGACGSLPLEFTQGRRSWDPKQPQDSFFPKPNPVNVLSEFKSPGGPSAPALGGVFSTQKAGGAPSAKPFWGSPLSAPGLMGSCPSGLAGTLRGTGISVQTPRSQWTPPSMMPYLLSKLMTTPGRSAH